MGMPSPFSTPNSTCPSRKMLARMLFALKQLPCFPRKKNRKKENNMTEENHGALVFDEEIIDVQYRYNFTPDQDMKIMFRDFCINM